MKSQSPALTQAALVSTARRKTRKVQRKLQEAEAELHTVNTVLVKAAPARNNAVIEKAVEKNADAQEKVHDAKEELAVVTELLAQAQVEGAGIAAGPAADSGGNSGQGAKSLIPHLVSRRDAGA